MADERLRSDEGAGAWVTAAPFVPRPEDVLDVDALLAEVDPLWRSLETICVAGCCGLDAFDFGAEAVRRAVAPAERATVAAKLADIQRRIEASPKTQVRSEQVGAWCPRGELVAGLEEIQRGLAG
jgi:CelD/BcsL family acetyltransferase involved in cellulose biosynthesis